MKEENIEILVEKYMAAESAMEEENMLRKALLEDDKSDHYGDLRALFGYFELQKEHTVIPDFQNPAAISPRRPATIISMPWLAAAASVAIIVLAFFIFYQTPATTSVDTFSDPKVAAQNAAAVLESLSVELNKGRAIAVEELKEFDNLNKYLNIF